jgi:hypothetical protein
MLSRSFADKRKSTEVGNKHHAVPLPVPLHLLGPGYPANIFRRWFGFNDTARGVLNQERIVFGVRVACLTAKLLGGEEAAVWQPRAPVGKVDDAPDARLERLADLVQQRRDRRVVGRFLHAGPGRVDLVDLV